MNYLGRCRAISLRRRCPVHRTWSPRCFTSPRDDRTANLLHARDHHVYIRGDQHVSCCCRFAGLTLSLFGSEQNKKQQLVNTSLSARDACHSSRARENRPRAENRDLPSPPKRAYMRRLGENLPTLDFCQVIFSTCWRSFFVILPKISICQVHLPNCWSCQKCLAQLNFPIELVFFLKKQLHK